MPDKQFRQFIATKEKTEEENTAIAAISTDAIDRDKEVILPKGVDFENYNKNPVVLWAHTYNEPPIGKAQWVKQGRKYIKAKWEWADTVKAQEIKQLWDGGFLNAVSVGFIANKSHEPTPAEIKKNPEWSTVYKIVDEWELLEFSIVPVPANPEALAGIKKLNLSEATQKELGVEENTTVFEEKEVEDTNNIEVEVKVKEEKKESVIVVPHRVIRPHRMVRIKIDPKDVTSTALNMLKGRIYM